MHSSLSTTESDWCKIAPNTIAIILVNDRNAQSADQAFVFRQTPIYFWLSGIDQEKTILIIYPDCPNPCIRKALFLRKTNEVIAVWERHKYTIDEARTASGIQQIFGKRVSNLH